VRIRTDSIDLDFDFSPKSCVGFLCRAIFYDKSTRRVRKHSSFRIRRSAFELWIPLENHNSRTTWFGYSSSSVWRQNGNAGPRTERKRNNGLKTAVFNPSVHYVHTDDVLRISRLIVYEFTTHSRFDNAFVYTSALGFALNALTRSNGKQLAAIMIMFLFSPSRLRSPSGQAACTVCTYRIIYMNILWAISFRVYFGST